MERKREWLYVSILVINHLHDLGVLDPDNGWDAYWQGWDQPPEILNAHVDDDIPARLEVHHQRTGPAWIEWRLWPDEPGQTTWGTVALHRFPGKPLFCVIGGGSYDRARRRSPRLSRIAVPDGKWGLRSSEFERFGIITTY